MEHDRKAKSAGAKLFFSDQVFYSVLKGNSGTAREALVAMLLAASGWTLEASRDETQGDFIISKDTKGEQQRFRIEVGGAGKPRKGSDFVIRDDIDLPVGRAIPMWLLAEVEVGLLRVVDGSFVFPLEALDLFGEAELLPELDSGGIIALVLVHSSDTVLVAEARVDIEGFVPILDMLVDFGGVFGEVMRFEEFGCLSVRSMEAEGVGRFWYAILLDKIGDDLVFAI